MEIAITLPVARLLADSLVLVLGVRVFLVRKSALRSGSRDLRAPVCWALGGAAETAGIGFDRPAADPDRALLAILLLLCEVPGLRLANDFVLLRDADAPACVQ